MTSDAVQGGGPVPDGPSEDNIRVVCRFRPLNDSEEKTGSKYVVKFPSGPEDNIVSIGVRIFADIFYCDFIHVGVLEREKKVTLVQTKLIIINHFPHTFTPL